VRKCAGDFSFAQAVRSRIVMERAHRRIAAMYDDYVYEPGDAVLRLADREERNHPDATLGSLFERFVSSPAVSTEMTAYAFRSTHPSEGDVAFLNQELFMCCLELGTEMRLDTLLLYAAQ
jgi:hypothetical protein